MKANFHPVIRSSAKVFSLTAVIAVSLLLAFLASAERTKPAARSVLPKGKPAEAVFKNIKALKGQPATQIIPTMQFISASLGVGCEFCHDEKAFDKDTKEEKRTAREMIAMQEAINKGHFKGKREITCNSCHHGAQHPASVPALTELTAIISEPEHEHAAHTPPQGAPAAYIDAFLQAAGGEAALAKLTSRTEHGTVSFGSGPVSNFESYTRSNGQRATTLALKQGTALSTFDGHTGWLAYPGRHTREMSPGEAEAVRVEADFDFPANFKQKYPQFRAARPESINGKLANVVQAIRPGQPPVKLYFDATSKLLVRVLYYVETPLGRNPTQIDIVHYTSAGGVQLPSNWIVTRPASRATYTVESSDNDAAIDDAKFAPPAATQAATH